MIHKSAIKSYLDTYLLALNAVEYSVRTKPVDGDAWLHGVLELLDKAKKTKAQIFFIGNGASCSMASHFAADFTKNAGITSFSVNDGALLSCFSNDFSFETAYSEILKRQFSDKDILVAISSSGKSNNILNAVDFVKSKCKKSRVISMSGFLSDNPLRKKGSCNLYVPARDYGLVESIHAYYLHLIIDLFIKEYI